MLRQKSFFLSFVLALLLGQFSPAFVQVAKAAPECGETEYGFLISNYQFVFTYEGEDTPEDLLNVYSQSNEKDELVKQSIPLVWYPSLCGLSASIGEQPFLTEWVKFDVNAVPNSTTGQTGKWANVKGQLIRRDWIPVAWRLTHTSDGTFNLLWCPSNLQAEEPYSLNVVDSRKFEILPGGDRSNDSSYWWTVPWEDLGGVCKQGKFPLEDAPYLVGFGFPFAASKGDAFAFPEDWLIETYQFGKFLRKWYTLQIPFVTNGG